MDLTITFRDPTYGCSAQGTSAFERPEDAATQAFQAWIYSYGLTEPSLILVQHGDNPPITAAVGDDTFFEALDWAFEKSLGAIQDAAHGATP